MKLNAAKLKTYLWKYIIFPKFLFMLKILKHRNVLFVWFFW